jgi:hypothetical protein
MEEKLLIIPCDDGLHVEDNGVDWIHGIDVAVPITGKWLKSEDGTLLGDVPDPLKGTDRLGAYTSWRVTYGDKERSLIDLTTKAYPQLRSVLFEAEALTDLEHTFTADTFVRTTFQAPIMKLMDAQFLLYTWSLGDHGDRGGWTHAIYGRSQRQIPRDKAFAPLVLSAQESAMVISALNHCPLSPLGVVDTSSGVTVSRGIHGAVDRIPRETVTSTIATFGDEAFSTMRSWGDILLSLGEYFKKEEIPIGYFGLDLWYPYERVGCAKAYRADKERFPSGLEQIKESTGIPFFLHLSGFDFENEYQDDYAFQQSGDVAYPREGRFYADLGRRLRQEEGAIGVWHDHIRHYQERIPALRTSFDAAEDWFFMMADELGVNSLPIMLSDPTIGFLLATSHATNIVSSRSGDDYLVKQERQLAQLDQAAAARYKRVPTQRLIIDRFLVGWLHYCLGLLPFHDVFITNNAHPDGFAESDADSEALMRALSAGPVGVGDKIGEIDRSIVNRLVFPDGLLAKPDRASRPVWSSLLCGLIVGETESLEGAWRYVSVFNVGTDHQEYDLRDAGIRTEGHVIYSPSLRQIVPEMRGRLATAEGAYYVLVPLLRGMAFIGFIDKYITAPSDRILSLKEVDGGFDVRMCVPPGHVYPIGVFCNDEIAADADRAEVAEKSVVSGLYVFTVTPTGGECRLKLRRGGNK